MLSSLFPAVLFFRLTKRHPWTHVVILVLKECQFQQFSKFQWFAYEGPVWPWIMCHSVKVILIVKKRQTIYTGYEDNRPWNGKNVCLRQNWVIKTEWSKELNLIKKVEGHTISYEIEFAWVWARCYAVKDHNQSTTSNWKTVITFESLTYWTRKHKKSNLPAITYQWWVPMHSSLIKTDHDSS